MAIMYNMATDWTYDQFIEDSKCYNATPVKGVHCKDGASHNEKFMTWFKNCARDFKNKWLESHEFMYDDKDGWIGDSFMKEFDDMYFSDYYKDTYGQRPHLDRWFYLQAVGLPSKSDMSYKFCAFSVEDAINRARRNREVC